MILAPISTQTGGAQIPRHARYPLRPPTPHAQPSAYQDRWPQQNPRSLVVVRRCPPESPPISSRCGQRKSSRGQTQILDVPTKVWSPPHHEPNHTLCHILCRETKRKRHGPSSLRRPSRCRQTRRAAISLCGGRGSKSRDGSHKNHMRYRLRGQRARFVSSWLALLKLEHQATNKSRPKDPAPNGPVPHPAYRTGDSWLILAHTTFFRVDSSLTKIKHLLSLHAMDIVLSHKISLVAELAGKPSHRQLC